MFKAIFSAFTLPKAQRLRKKHLEEAQRLEVEYRAAAEHAEAMASMYAARVARLTQEVAQDEAAEATPARTGLLYTPTV